MGGYVAMNLVMPYMLSWVLGGNLSVFKASDRRPLCHLCDKPKHFEEQASLRKRGLHPALSQCTALVQLHPCFNSSMLLLASSPLLRALEAHCFLQCDHRQG